MISIRRARGRAGRPRGSDLDVSTVAIASWCVCLTRSKALEYSDAAAALFVASHDLKKKTCSPPDQAQPNWPGMNLHATGKDNCKAG